MSKRPGSRRIDDAIAGPRIRSIISRTRGSCGIRRATQPSTWVVACTRRRGRRPANRTRSSDKSGLSCESSGMSRPITYYNSIFFCTIAGRHRETPGRVAGGLDQPFCEQDRRPDGSPRSMADDLGRLPRSLFVVERGPTSAAPQGVWPTGRSVPATLTALAFRVLDGWCKLPDR